MAGMDEEARRIALEMISILVVKPGDFLKISKFSTSFPGVDADEVAPGIFIGNKYVFFRIYSAWASLLSGSPLPTWSF